MSHKIISKKQLSEDVFMIETEAKLIAKARKPGQFVIVCTRGNYSERIPLTIAGVDKEAGTITLKLEYCTRLFKSRRIENFLEQYIKIAEQVCGDSEMKIEDIEMMAAAEVKRVQAAIHRDMADIHMDLDI